MAIRLTSTCSILYTWYRGGEGLGSGETNMVRVYMYIVFQWEAGNHDCVDPESLDPLCNGSTSY